MKDDTVSRAAAIDALFKVDLQIYEGGCAVGRREYMTKEEACTIIDRLPSAQSEISRIEQELHGKTPEEQYEFLYWLLLKFGLAYTDSRLAVIEWLKGEQDG